MECQKVTFGVAYLLPNSEPLAITASEYWKIQRAAMRRQSKSNNLGSCEFWKILNVILNKGRSSLSVLYNLILPAE